jgi:hypothetical protein
MITNIGNKLFCGLKSIRENNLPLMFIILAAILTDILLAKTSCITNCITLLPETLPILSAIVVIYCFGQFLLLRFVRNKSTEIWMNNRRYLRVMHKTIMITQFILAALVVLVIVQIVFQSYYYTLILIISTSISYTLAILMMMLLAKRFFTWYTSKRNFVILFYAFAASALAVNAAFTLFSVIDSLLGRPTEVRPFLTLDVFYISDQVTYILNESFIISSIISFLLAWGATAMLLQHYSKGYGKFKYWVIISMPLAYFVSQFITLFINILGPFVSFGTVFVAELVTVLFVLSKPAGGILFGAAFWAMARQMKQDVVVRNYMIISAYGFILLFTSNQAVVLINVPYPPFGLVTICFVGLSSYLVFTGIYSTAISIAQDDKLRDFIRNLTMQQSSKLLDSIGSAEVEQDIRKKIMVITKLNQHNMVSESGVQSSVTEDDIKQYLDEVIREVEESHRKES